MLITNMSLWVTLIRDRLGSQSSTKFAPLLTLMWQTRVLVTISEHHGTSTPPMLPRTSFSLIICKQEPVTHRHTMPTLPKNA